MLPTTSFFAPGTPVPREVPPPQGFRPLQLPLRNVEFTLKDEFIRQRGNSVAKENGLRYESQVQEYLLSELGTNYTGIDLLVTDAQGQRRKLIPDGIYLSHDVSVLFEVKSQHMPEAWWQLRKLYQPAMEFKRPKHLTLVIEVCKTYDPAMPFPEEVELITDLKAFIHSRSRSFGVLVWRK